MWRTAISDDSSPPHEEAIHEDVYGHTDAGCIRHDRRGGIVVPCPDVRTCGSFERGHADGDHAMTRPPAWLRGAVADVLPLLQPVAHSLLDCVEDVRATLPGLSPEMIAARPNAAASIGFHVRHAMGSLDRLFTYARGEALTAAQLAVLRQESDPGDDSTAADELVAAFDAAFDRAMAQVRATDERDLLMAREVGRAKLPSTVIGLLSHAAEHTQRHVGQIVTTARIVKHVPPGTGPQR